MKQLEITPLPWKNQDWMKQAACRDLAGPLRDAIFFPEKGNNSERARDICHGQNRTRKNPGSEPCPVLDECLLYVLSLPIGETVGVWAGTTQNERRHLKMLQDRGEDLIPHGTYRGYRQEQRRGLTPCEACKKAKKHYYRRLK